MGRMRRTNAIGMMLVLLVVSTFSCQKEGEWFGPIQAPADSSGLPLGAVTYLIGCEGNFQYSNASLSAYYPDSSRIEQRVFERTNGFTPGDVLQSMLQIDSLIYLVMNNSGVIRAINANDFEESLVFDGLVSPRYMIPIDDERLLVSSFGAGAISVLNRSNGQVEQQIPAPNWTEELCKQGQYIYVSGKSDSSLLVIAANTLQIEKKIELAGDPIGLAVLDDQVFLALQDQDQLQLLSLNGINLQVIGQRQMQISDLQFTADGLHILTPDSIIQLNLTGETVNTIAHQLQTPYSIYADELRIIVTDVFDYLSNGEIIVYNLELNRIENHTTGIIPQAVLRIQ